MKTSEKRMIRVESVMSVVCFCACMAFSALDSKADTAIWTGAQDAYWTNVNNWVQSDGVTPATAVPGVLENGTEDVDPYTAVYDTALFNRSSSHTTIDLSGLYAVRNITVSGATTPIYTFGVSSDQTLRFVSEAQCNSYNNGGVFLIETSVVNMPRIAATLSARCSGTLNEGFHITNKSAEPMVLGDIGRFTDAAELGIYPENIKDKNGNFPSWATTSASGIVFVQLDGTGPFTLGGKFVAGKAGRYKAFIFKSSSGYAVAENCDITSVRSLNVVANTSLSIPAGSRFSFEPGGDFTVSSGGGFVTQGEGLFELQGRASGDGRTILYLYANSPWTSASRLSVTNLSGASLESTELHYGGVGKLGEHGTINFLGENLFAGTYSFTAGNQYSGPRYTAPSLGADGEPGPMGRTSLIRLSNNGTFAYTGPGETSSRTFEIIPGKDTLGGNTMVLEQAGTGVWTVESRIRQACAEGTLVLRNATSVPAVFARALGGEMYNGVDAALSLRKEGSGEWRLAAQNVYTGTTTIEDGTLTLAPGGTIDKSSEVVLKGGALEVSGTAGSPRAVTLPRLKIDTDSLVTLCVTDGAVVTVSAIERVTGRLNICTAGEGSVVKLPPSFAGATLDWIRFNGAAVNVAEDGTVSVGSEIVTTQIPARGGVISNDAAASVGITTPGTEGPVTLAAASVTVSNLVQQSDTEATVDLAGGTLTARLLLLDSGDRAPFTVGTTSGNGAVKPLDGTLFLDNRSTNGSVLTVAAPLDLSSSDWLVKSGPGQVRLTEPLDFSGTLDIEQGELAVSNITTIAPTLVGAGVFVKEGSGDFRFPNVRYMDFTGEIRCSGGTNALPTNTNMRDVPYFLRFTEGTTIAPFSQEGSYDTQNMRVHVSGDGADGEGVMCLNIAGNARVFPFLTLDGDTSFNALYPGCWLQFGGSKYDLRAGVLDMGGHKFIKRDGAGSFRFSDGGRIENPGEIIVDHFTGTEGKSTIELYNGFSLGGPGAPALTLGSNTVLRSINADAQTRKLHINGSNVQLQITPGACTGPGDVWGGLEFASAEDSLAVNYATVGDWRVDFTGPLTGSGTLTLGGSSSTAAGTVNFLAAENDFDGKIVVNPDTRLNIAGPFADNASPSVSVKGSVALGTADWTPAQVEKFVKSAELSGNGNVVLDGSSGTLADLSDFSLPLTMTIGSVGGIARVSLKDVSLMSWSVVNDDEEYYLKADGSADYYTKAIVVGDRGSGILEIGEGAAITNRLVVGGNAGSPRGAVYQSGGHFCSFGSPGDALSAAGLGLGESSKSYGYYELTGGVLELTGGHTFGVNGASAVLYVDGGDIVSTRRPANCNPQTNWCPSLNLAYNGHTVVEIRSGHMNLSDRNVLTCRGGTPSLVFTVSGEDARVTVPTMFCCGYAASSCSIVNIADGGRFTAPYIYRNNTASTSRTYVNFDGGIFETTTSDSFWVFGGRGQETMVSKVTVFGGGATIETPVATYSPMIWEVSGPTGKGISSVNAAPICDMTLVGSPRVVIEGDGWGASAYADFDSASGKVTGIRVTSPGCDYTEATAKVLYGDTVLAENLAVTLEDNVGGPFAKSGPGTLQLMATNTWHGATVVKEGTLSAKTDGSIPQGRPLVLDGGTIDLGGFGFTFAGITGSGGTVSGGTANIAGEWRLDAGTLVADKAARRCTTVSGNVAVASGVNVTVSDPELLDESKFYRILRVNGGALTGGEDITTDLPPPWKVTRVSAGFLLSCPRGLRIIVR